MLALSSAIASFGYILGISMLFIGALNLFLGLHCFKKLMFEYKSAKIYSELVKEMVGEKLEAAVNWIFIIYVWGTLIGYILVSHTFIK